MALVAAVPGFLDWLFGIPQNHAAKGVGLKHLILNVTALAFFALNAWLLWGQWDQAVPNPGWAVWLTGLGVAATVVAGYLGYEMIQRHHVGVDLTPEQQRLEPVNPERVQGDTAYRHA
jgi:uncharacterized membrane protein